MRIAATEEEWPIAAKTRDLFETLSLSSKHDLHIGIIVNVVGNNGTLI